jgi:hypothetical protein
VDVKWKKTSILKTEKSKLNQVKRSVKCSNVEKQIYSGEMWILKKSMA